MPKHFWVVAIGVSVGVVAAFFLPRPWGVGSYAILGVAGIAAGIVYEIIVNIDVIVERRPLHRDRLASLPSGKGQAVIFFDNAIIRHKRRRRSFRHSAQIANS